MSSRSPTATLDDEDAVEEEVKEARLELQHRVGNGPLNEDISTEGSAKDELTESNWKAEASGENDESPSYSVWRNVSEAEELERPLSPSSSGYAGERGSTSGGCEINDDDEDSNEILEVQSGGDLGSHAQWVSGKRHPHEDDASVSWRKRKKHFFILSNSGKPIYSRYGDEHKLAGFSATLQAIISFVENGGDRVKLVRAGNHQCSLSKRTKFDKHFIPYCKLHVSTMFIRFPNHALLSTFQVEPQMAQDLIPVPKILY
ncbi:SAND family protein [Striga hermonthica]|uniref:Vacuolar fusion protein MON1 homolog n=1 Tax=Striga hermonthica TaxID=68872 RepID=A0A9N7RN57_STRHE|nr:SAND family protein [Striga hermonthica]